MKIAFVINAKRYPLELKKKLEAPELSAQYGISYDIFLAEPELIEEIANKIKTKGYHAVIIGGGDGTARAAIQALVDSDLIIGIFPLGSFNLLAKTLEYPADIDAFFTMIKNGKTKKIDLITVNKTLVINHAWIGFYFYLLKIRKRHKEFIGKNKLLKIIFNTLNFFRLLPIYHLEFQVDKKKIQYHTGLVFISNNRCKINLFELGERESMSSGLLEVTILKCKTRWQLFMCMLSLFLKQQAESKYLTRFEVDELIISAKSNYINVVLDGDLFKLSSPLRFISHQKQLTVFTP